MEERAIDRLRKFARYARDKGVVKGENSFEAYCELSNRYIYNSIRNGKGAIGTDIIARIVDKFPELNVKWLCTGKGNMIETDIDANVNYKAAYEGAMMQIEALHKIIGAMGVSMLFMCVEIFLVQFLLRQYLGQVKDKGRSKV